MPNQEPRLSPAGLLSLLRQSPVINTPEGRKLAEILAKSSNCNEVKVRVNTAVKAAAKNAQLPYNGQKLAILMRVPGTLWRRAQSPRRSMLPSAPLLWQCSVFPPFPRLLL